MANGDVTHAEIEAFLKVGAPFPSSSSTTLTETEADALCGEVNAEVNLALKQLGFSLPISDTDSLTWLKLTKTLGSAAYILDGLMAQDTQEDNTRAQRLWTMYERRLSKLFESGGEVIQADRQADPRPTNVPIAVGEWEDQQRKRFLRFPQRAAADQYDDEVAIHDTSADWYTVVRGL